MLRLIFLYNLEGDRRVKDCGRIYRKVAEEILRLIDTDKFPGGSRLPSERELAQQFNVSRDSIRKAQIILEVQGYLKVKACSGVYVFDKNLPNSNCYELIEAHALFTAEVAALATHLISDDTIKELERLAAIIVGKVKCETSPKEAVATFFNLIAKATNNRAIIFSIESMWKMKPEDNQTHRSYQSVFSQFLACFETEYQAIIEALKKRDPAQSRKAVHEHFSGIMKGFLRASELDAYQKMNLNISKTRSRFLLSSQMK